MAWFDLASELRGLEEQLGTGALKPDTRDEADARFRDRYRMLLASESVPAAVMEPLRRALIALVGDDNWDGARRHVGEAIRRLEAEGVTQGS